MKEKDNKAFWQRVARFYTGFMRKNEKLYDELGEVIAPKLTPDMDVLELACGTGQLSFPLAGRVHLWEATDFSDAMIMEARKAEAPIQLIFSVQDATELPYKENRFDAVVISNALHLIPHPEKVMKEISRVLKPGGKLYAPTFAWGKGLSHRFHLAMMWLFGFRLYSAWTEKELVSFICKFGFSVTEHRKIGNTFVPLCYLEAKKKSGK